MATILNFPAAATRDRSSEPSLEPQCSAEIVIFPGIRYEHWDEGEAPKPTKAKRRKGRARDTLILED